MKILKNAIGPKVLKMSRVDWFLIGRKAGWIKQSQDGFDVIENDWDLDEGFEQDGSVMTGIRYETTIDYGLDVGIPVTIVYDYTRPGADTEWVPITDIVDILDKSGKSVKEAVYRLEPDFKITIEQDLSVNGARVAEEHEERTTIIDQEDYDSSAIPEPGDIGTDYGFQNTPMITDRERMF